MPQKGFLLFLSKFVSTCCLDLLKKGHISNFNGISLKKRGKLFWNLFFLHLTCYIAHQWFTWTTRNLSFRIYFYIATRRSLKIRIIFSLFSRGWNTHPGGCSDLDKKYFVFGHHTFKSSETYGKGKVFNV